MSFADASSDLEWIKKFDPKKIRLRGRSYYIAKRIMDVSLVLLFMPVWLPVLGLVAFVVWLSDPSAPVFFAQRRTGKGGRMFTMYKVRTMVKNAEELKLEYAHLNKLQWPDFKIINDPRVTPVGRFLRKTRLDELPQFFNILRGQMSLVGPRPTSFGPETYRLWQTERLDVLPGLTGLWQVVRQDDSEFDERLRLDITYIERRGLWFDIMILIKTLLAFFRFMRSKTF
jgi:lipopolysaccharide/colanic/teichoic acid biosynthesis glycosyltransferase